MKNIGLILLIYLNLLTSAYSQNSIKFTPVSSTQYSVLPAVEGLPYEGKLANTTCLIKEGGTYYLLFNDIVGDWPPKAVNVTFATSRDLTNWKLLKQPILTNRDLPFDTEKADMPLATTIVKGPDGKYHMYFHVFKAGIPVGIGTASSEKLTGSWQVHKDLVLTPGETGWDANRVMAPYVIVDKGRYIMYYVGASDSKINASSAVGIATSMDGITWTKRSTPVFTKSESGKFDSYKIDVARVIKDEERWLMIYRTDNGDPSWGGETAYGMAVSDDGLSWKRVQDRPVLHENDIENWRSLWGFAFYKEGDVYHLFVEYDGPPMHGTRVSHTTYTGSVSK